ncbi:TPA: hypothetical protein ACH3X2_002684 [Trebouxia sp. C0005]
MGPEDREWLFEDKLKMLMTLQGLQALGRSAPQVVKASTDVPAQSGKASSGEKEPGRPAGPAQQLQQAVFLASEKGVQTGCSSNTEAVLCSLSSSDTASCNLPLSTDGSMLDRSVVK